MNSPAPRIRPGDRRDIGVVNHVISGLAGRAIGGGRLHVMTTLGRHRRLFRAWLIYSAALMPGGRLPRTDTELIILRIAELRACSYEQAQHERIARKVGLTSAHLSHLDDPAWPGWSERQRTLLEATAAIVRQRILDDSQWNALRMHLDETECIEFLMLCGQYDSLATTLLTLGVEVEVEVEP